MAYLTVSELRDEVLAKCQDPSCTTTHILRYMNQCIKEISARVQLPALMVVDGDTITTTDDDNYISLPSNFQRNLYKCHSNTNNRDIKIYSSPAALDKWFSDLDAVGSIVAVAEYGSNLYYQHRADEDLQIYYLKEPVALTLSTSKPTDLPEEHANSLLINYVLTELYMNKQLYEQADLYRNLFEREFSRLEGRLGAERKPPTDVEDALFLDYLY